MHKLIRKLLGKLNIEIAFVFAVFVVSAVLIVGGFDGATYVLAANTATQTASSTVATTISVVAKTTDDPITTISFPQAAPGATVSIPYNDTETGNPQVLSATVSEPVVRLKNTSGGTYNVTLAITTWTNSVTDMEYYNLANSGAVNIETVTTSLSEANGGAKTVATGVSIPTTEYKDLYLKLVLSSVAGKTGTSTLTILGETP